MGSWNDKLYRRQGRPLLATSAHFAIATFTMLRTFLKCSFYIKRILFYDVPSENNQKENEISLIHRSKNTAHFRVSDVFNILSYTTLQIRQV